MARLRRKRWVISGAHRPDWQRAIATAAAAHPRSALGQDFIESREAPVTAGAAYAEYWGPGDRTCLFPEEAALVRGARAERVDRFAAGRGCARRAIVSLGAPAQAIGATASGSPVWPPGLVGSITHTETFAAAAVAPSERLRGLGIDAEPIGVVSETLWPLLFTPGERAFIRRFDAPRRQLLSTLMFGAKEALFKCMFPLFGVWIDFLDVEIHGLPDAARARASAVVTNRAEIDSIRFDHWTRNDHAVTIAYLARSQARSDKAPRAR